MAVWLVRAGSHGALESAALEEGLSIIGWSEMPDLSQALSRRRSRAYVTMRVPSRTLTPAAIEASPEARAWLDQFSSKDRLTALSLLTHLRFTSRDAFSNWLLIAVLAFWEGRPCGVYSVRKLDGNRRQLWDHRGCVIERPGRSLGSEDLADSLVSNATRTQERLYNHPSLPELRDRQIHDVILIDDSIGSGERVSTYIRAMLASKTFLSWWSFGFIRFRIFSFARTREAEKAILDAIPGSDHGKRVHPKSSKIGFDSHIVYSKDSLHVRWGDGYRAILRLCDSIEAIPEWFRRGFGGVMSNTVFDHSVPDNIPGVLWYTNDEWSPIFPQRAVPRWMVDALDGRSARFEAVEEHRVMKEFPMMFGLLRLIKRGVRRRFTIALEMEADNDAVGSLLDIARASGLITPHNRITAAGMGLIRGAESREPVTRSDRTLYVPASWCADRATVQPSALPQTDPACAGGEVR